MLSSAAPHSVLANGTSQYMEPQDRLPVPAVIPATAMVLPCRFLESRQCPNPMAPAPMPPHMPLLPATLAGLLPGLHSTPAPLAPLTPPLPAAPPGPPAPPLPGSNAAPGPTAGRVTPVGALIPEITNLVPEFRRVALDPARAAPALSPPSRPPPSFHSPVQQASP